MTTSLSSERLIRTSFLFLIIMGLTSFFSSISFAATDNSSNKVHEYQLKNGMKVLVKQDKRAPVAVIQVWYKIGTSYEHEGITGLSHLLEHMMFKGTKKRASGEF